MILISRFGRPLGVLLCVLYIFTGSSLDKLTYQGISQIYRTAVFPCKDKGCQCDKAGYELPNCQCDHANNISCCSEEVAILETEENCCSEEVTNSKSCTIKNLPCQGIEDNEVFTMVKHLIFLPYFEKEKKLYLETAHTPYISSIVEAEIFSLDKVPIFS